MSSNRQNYQSDIPKGRSTSRIKNASQSQGFANKDLYGSSARTGTVNGHFYKSQNNSQKASRQRANNSRNNQNRTANQTRNKSNNNGEISESTIVKVIAGSILAAVILAIIIIIALSFMDFHI